MLVDNSFCDVLRAFLFACHVVYIPDERAAINKTDLAKRHQNHEPYSMRPSRC